MHSRKFESKEALVAYAKQNGLTCLSEFLCQMAATEPPKPLSTSPWATTWPDACHRWSAPRLIGTPSAIADWRIWSQTSARQTRTPEGDVMTDPNVTGDGQTVTIRIRISIRKRLGSDFVTAST